MKLLIITLTAILSLFNSNVIFSKEPSNWSHTNVTSYIKNVDVNSCIIIAKEESTSGRHKYIETTLFRIQNIDKIKLKIKKDIISGGPVLSLNYVVKIGESPFYRILFDDISLLEKSFRKCR